MTPKTRATLSAGAGAGIIATVVALNSLAPIPPGPYHLCGANLCGSDEQVANEPPLAPPCAVSSFDTSGDVTAFVARTVCDSPATGAFLLERDFMGRSKRISVNMGNANQVREIAVAPNAAHVVFRAGRNEGTHDWRLFRADPHGAGTVAITPSSPDGATDVEPGWAIDCGSEWVRYTQFDQVEFRQRFVPITGGVILDAPPAGVTWGPCTLLIFRNGFEGGNVGAWS